MFGKLMIWIIALVPLSTAIALVSESKTSDMASIEYLGEFPALAATSCQQIHDLRRHNAKSGYYWIQNNCCPKRIYCEMNMADCGGGVWTKVANIDMSIPSMSCPNGFEKVTSPRSCRKLSFSAGCSSANFSTYGQSYKKVCGKIIGYQNSTPDAFHSYLKNRLLTLDDVYVDGVSVTYNYPREHIWTFAAQPDLNYKNKVHGCPCARGTIEGKVPRFVGSDFFCETGCEDTNGHIFGTLYTTHKLWDGYKYGTFPQGCKGTRSPWFRKEFSYDVESNIEVRSCLDQDRSDEEILIEQIHLYIQ